MLKRKNDWLKMAPEEGAAGGFEVSEAPVERIEFEMSPDGLTSEERSAQVKPAAPVLDPNVAALIEAQKQQIEALKAGVANPPKSEQSGNGVLEETLAKMAAIQEAQAKPQVSQKTYEQLQEEIKDLWFSDPMKAQMKVMEFYEQTRLGPAVGQLKRELDQAKEELAEVRGQAERQSLGNDPRAKFAMEKYKDEVEQLAKQYKGQPGAMMRAAREVSLNHDGEYMDAWFAQKQAQVQVAAGPAAMAGPGVGGVTGGQPVVKKVAWTPVMEQDRLAYGMTREDYLQAVDRGWIADPRKK